MEQLQTKVAKLQRKVTELGKKGDTSHVSGQHLATSNDVPTKKRFNEEILQDRAKILDLVKSAFKKKDAEDDSKDEVPDKDAAIEAPALVHNGILVHIKDAPKDEVDQSVSEATLQVGLDVSE